MQNMYQWIFFTNTIKGVKLYRVYGRVEIGIFQIVYQKGEVSGICRKENYLSIG